VNGPMLHAADRAFERLSDEQRAPWTERAKRSAMFNHHTSARAEYIADYLRRKIREQAREEAQ
jgi:gluconate kinase